MDGDGRPDFLYGAGSGLLIRNTGKGFEEIKESGLSFKAGKISPAFGDFDGDGHPDLFVPQESGSKLYRNDGKGHFTDVTAKAGDLAKSFGWATCAAWGDVDNDGRLDLVVGCLKGPNRVFRNKGDGSFEDITESMGLHQRIFNTQAIALVDLNGDGVLDFVFNNEGQESCVLLGNTEFVKGLAAVTLNVGGKDGVVGSRVSVHYKDGKTLVSTLISGGEGRGGQPASQARFALNPGTYRVEVRFSSGVRRTKEIVVATSQVRAVIDDSTPKMD